MTLPRLSLVALVALAACDGASVEVDPLSPDLIDLRALSQDPDALIGTWDLVASLNPEGGTLTTPAQTGRTEAWTFRRDGTVTTVFGGDQVLVRDYRVARRPGRGSGRATIEFDGGGYGEDFGMAGDVLVLDSSPVDGPQSRYRRR